MDSLKRRFDPFIRKNKRRLRRKRRFRDRDESPDNKKKLENDNDVSLNKKDENEKNDIEKKKAGEDEENNDKKTESEDEENNDKKKKGGDEKDDEEGRLKKMLRYAKESTNFKTAAGGILESMKGFLQSLLDFIQNIPSKLRLVVFLVIGIIGIGLIVILIYYSILIFRSHPRTIWFNNYGEHKAYEHRYWLNIAKSIINISDSYVTFIKESPTQLSTQSFDPNLISTIQPRINSQYQKWKNMHQQTKKVNKEIEEIKTKSEKQDIYMKALIRTIYDSRGIEEDYVPLVHILLLLHDELNVERNYTKTVWIETYLDIDNVKEIAIDKGEKINENDDIILKEYQEYVKELCEQAYKAFDLTTKIPLNKKEFKITDAVNDDVFVRKFDLGMFSPFISEYLTSEASKTYSPIRKTHAVVMSPDDITSVDQAKKAAQDIVDKQLKNKTPTVKDAILINQFKNNPSMTLYINLMNKGLLINNLKEVQQELNIIMYVNQTRDQISQHKTEFEDLLLFAVSLCDSLEFPIHFVEAALTIDIELNMLEMFRSFDPPSKFHIHRPFPDKVFPYWFANNFDEKGHYLQYWIDWWQNTKEYWIATANNSWTGFVFLSQKWNNFTLWAQDKCTFLGPELCGEPDPSEKRKLGSWGGKASGKLGDAVLNCWEIMLKEAGEGNDEQIQNFCKQKMDETMDLYSKDLETCVLSTTKKNVHFCNPILDELLADYTAQMDEQINQIQSFREKRQNNFLDGITNFASGIFNFLGGAFDAIKAVLEIIYAILKVLGEGDVGKLIGVIARGVMYIIVYVIVAILDIQVLSKDRKMRSGAIKTTAITIGVLLVWLVLTLPMWLLATGFFLLSLIGYVLVGLLYLGFAIIDIITGGRIGYFGRRFFTCKNIPDNWYQRPMAYRGNSYKQLRFFGIPIGCMRPCRKSYIPISGIHSSFLGIPISGGFCKRKRISDNNYAPLSNIIRLYLGETDVEKGYNVFTEENKNYSNFAFSLVFNFFKSEGNITNAQYTDIAKKICKCSVTRSQPLESSCHTGFCGWDGISAPWCHHININNTHTAPVAGTYEYRYMWVFFSFIVIGILAYLYKNWNLQNEPINTSG